MSARKSFVDAVKVEVVDLEPGKAYSGPDAPFRLLCRNASGDKVSEHVVRCGSFRQALEALTSALQSTKAVTLFRPDASLFTAAWPRARR